MQPAGPSTPFAAPQNILGLSRVPCCRIAATLSAEAYRMLPTRGKSKNPKLVAIRQDFSGAFSGRALLIFPEASSLELVRVVVGRQLSLEDIVNLEDEALAETGNIILNSWVATIAV